MLDSKAMMAMLNEIVEKINAAPKDEKYIILWEIPREDMELCSDGWRAREDTRTWHAIMLINSMLGAICEAVTIERKDKTGWALMAIHQ